MDAYVVGFVLSNLLLVAGASLFMPAIVAALYAFVGQESLQHAGIFAALGLAVACLGALGRRILPRHDDHLGLREGYAIVTFSWLLMACVGMLPYLLILPDIAGIDAFFEAMSGLTTTGASIFADVETLPQSLQFWRCMTQWLGGMGVVVLVLALLPVLGAGGFRLLKAETPGGIAYERERPRIADTAKAMWKLYLGLSAAAILTLWLLGMSPFDAVCHGFTTLSTGGFSTHTASAVYFSPGIQWALIGFMFVAGINFSLHPLLFAGRFKKVWQQGEFRVYLAVLAVAIVLGVAIVPRAADFEPHLRAVVFQVVTIATTTGFATADFDAWPELMRASVFVLMMVGGCMGSTSGGIKMARLAIWAKAAHRQLHQQIYPHAIRPVRLGKRVLESGVVSHILGFGVLFVAAMGIGTAAMAASGYSLETSLSAAASALGNIGPGLGPVGPMGHWGHLPAPTKAIMAFLMLTGRLEIYSVWILLTPWAWRR